MMRLSNCVANLHHIKTLLNGSFVREIRCLLSYVPGFWEVYRRFGNMAQINDLFGDYKDPFDRSEIFEMTLGI